MGSRRNAVLLWAGIAIMHVGMAYRCTVDGHYFFAAVAGNVAIYASGMAFHSAFGKSGVSK